MELIFENDFWHMDDADFSDVVHGNILVHCIMLSYDYSYVKNCMLGNI